MKWKKDYVTSFAALSKEEEDEKIERLMRDLEGVTHVRAIAGPLLDNVPDVEDYEAPTDDGGEEEEEVVRTPPPKRQTGITSTALPRRGARESEVTYLINSIFESFTTAFYERLNKVKEKVDKVVEQVGRVEEEVGEGIESSSS